VYIILIHIVSSSLTITSNSQTAARLSAWSRETGLDLDDATSDSAMAEVDETEANVVYDAAVQRARTSIP